MKARLYILFLLLVSAFTLQGQRGNMLYAQDTVAQQTEIRQNIGAGDKYLSARINALEKYSEHTARVQKQLLTKLSHAAHHLTGLPAAGDSRSANPPGKYGISFDSLQRSAANPSSLYNKGSPKIQKIIDSLKGIQAFIRQQSGRLSRATDLTQTAGIPGDYGAKLQRLRQQLSAQEQLQKLIDQRSQALQQLFPGKNIPALSRITRQIAIAKAKAQSWKQLADDPDAAEEKAYEYLQGIQGFNNYLNTGNKAFGGLGNNPSVADLQRLGYQTKDMVSKSLQQQFGDNLDKARQQISQQLAAYQKDLSEVTGKVKEARSLLGDAKNSAIGLKPSLQHIQQPAFKNPMRGVPFPLRWQPRYDFQTSRAVGSRPALLSFSAGLAYRQTPKLKMGLGLAADIGMGKDWQHLKLSYEGLSLRAFADYEMIFGIAVEGGYERTFRPASRSYVQNDGTTPTQSKSGNNIIQKTFGSQQQAAYIGLMKSYRINSKWNGAFMIGYNFLYRRYGLKAPLMIRIGWEK